MLMLPFQRSIENVTYLWLFFSKHHQQSFLSVVIILYLEDTEMCNLFSYAFPLESPTDF